MRSKIGLSNDGRSTRKPSQKMNGLSWRRTMKNKFLVVCLIVAAWTGSAAAADVTLSLGFVGGAQSPEAIALRQFADEIEAKTDGRIAISLQGGGVLGGDR